MGYRSDAVHVPSCVSNQGPTGLQTTPQDVAPLIRAGPSRVEVDGGRVDELDVE